MPLWLSVRCVQWFFCSVFLLCTVWVSVCAVWLCCSLCVVLLCCIARVLCVAHRLASACCITAIDSVTSPLCAIGITTIVEYRWIVKYVNILASLGEHGPQGIKGERKDPPPDEIRILCFWTWKSWNPPSKLWLWRKYWKPSPSIVIHQRYWFWVR